MQEWEKGLPKKPNRTAVIRQIILSHILWREPRTADQIWELVKDDWGSVSDMTIYRHLKKMAKAGVVTKTSIDDEFHGYVRIELPQWDRREQVYQ